MLFAILGVLLSIQPVAQQHAQNPLERLSFLVGRWSGEGTGVPGNSVGEFSFDWDLKQNVLARRSFAEYPATKDRPASRHDDLIVVFAEAGKWKAEYFDSEGHVIHYAITPAADGKSIEFLSDRVPGAPRYRLTYAKAGDANSMKTQIRDCESRQGRRFYDLHRCDASPPALKSGLSRLRRSY